MTDEVHESVRPGNEAEGMMWELVFWTYLINSIFLINHEIDSAYWKEWNLFKLPGGLTGFLIIHFPLLFVILYGLALVSQHADRGLIFSLVISFGGLFAFTIHMVFIRRGRDEFRTSISILILAGTVLTSIFQAIITLYLMLHSFPGS